MSLGCLWFRKHHPDVLPGVYYFIWLIRGCSTGQGIIFCPLYPKQRAGFFLGFIVRGRSPEWPKVTSFLRGSGGMPPRKFFKMNMHWDAIWCISRHNFEKCYSVFTDLVASGRCFRYSYLYTTIRIFFLGGTGHFGGKLLPLKYPR